MNGWNWQLKTVFLHDITIILFRLMIIFTELALSILMSGDGAG